MELAARGRGMRARLAHAVPASAHLASGGGGSRGHYNFCANHGMKATAVASLQRDHRFSLPSILLTAAMRP